MNKLYVIGIGPGEASQMTPKAKDALDKADVIAGYKTYIELIKDQYPEKEILQTPMKAEVERCKMALERARMGDTVAMISSGDAGIYGMAGLILEMKADYPSVKVEVIAGITAASSGAAVLGAPLMHDFCVISLSDLMTPWEIIENRLRMAAKGDFGIVLYNPSSHKRHDYLKKACDILLEELEEERVCGYVKNIGRQEQAHVVVSLQQLSETSVDMFTTVFIGNSKTKKVDNYMVTPRGYIL